MAWENVNRPIDLGSLGILNLKYYDLSFADEMVVVEDNQCGLT